MRVILYSGLIAMIIGLIAFCLSWNLWTFFGGPLPAYQIFLFPGNLTLIYFWHPLFTEEINFWPKLLMLLLGQFVVVSSLAAVVIWVRVVWLRKLRMTTVTNIIDFKYKKHSKK